MARPKPNCGAKLKGPCAAAQLLFSLRNEEPLKCDYLGNYEEVQCPEHLAQCYCVNKTTGEVSGRKVHSSFGSRQVCVGNHINSIFNFFG